jgi:gluconolactonase
VKRKCYFVLIFALALAAADPVREASVGAGEGPAWDGKGSLFFTGRGRITRRDDSGKYHVVREGAGGANGLLFDFEGRLVICEGGNRRVVRMESDGKTTVLADSFEGKRFNSPNDLAIDSKGRIYFSDPRYGNRAGMELEEGVYRIDAPGKVARVLDTEIDRPNGLLVSPRDKYLYVADNNNDTQGGARKLWRFDLNSDGTVNGKTRKLIFDWKTGRGPDGLDMDEAGRLFVAAGRNTAHPPFELTDEFKGGVYVLSPEGKLLEFIPITDDEVTNVAFGGLDRKTLFVTAGGNLWSVRVRTPGWVQRNGRSEERPQE